MSDAARGELADLARLLGAHLEWQRDLGLSAVRFERVNRAGPARSAPASRAAGEPATAPVEARAAEPVVSAPTSAGAWREALRGAPAPSAPQPAAAPPAPKPPVVLESASAPPAPAPRVVTPAEPIARPTPRALPVVASNEARPRIAENLLAGEPVEGQARLDALAKIRAEVEQCTSCRLAQGRTRTVFSRGSAFAPVAFVGEGPGRDEDLQGLPFVGAAGQLLDRIIGAMGLNEDEVWVGNVVKCRPPNNRVPAPDEMGACGGYLKRQLSLVRPKLIVALGKTAAGYLLGSDASMSRMRGKWFEWHGVPLLPTWHPAYLLRTPDAKRDTWEDMKRVLERLGRTPPSPSAGRAQQ